jgi:hypothetical protein
MKTQRPRRLSFLAALVVSAVVFALYKIFKTDELDREIQKEMNN